MFTALQKGLVRNTSPQTRRTPYTYRQELRVQTLIYAAGQKKSRFSNLTHSKFCKYSVQTSKNVRGINETMID